MITFSPHRWIPSRHGLGALSARELEVLKLLGAGLTSKEASKQLGIATQTVGSHKQRLCEKLGLPNKKNPRDIILFSLAKKIVENPFETPSSKFSHAMD